VAAVVVVVVLPDEPVSWVSLAVCELLWLEAEVDPSLLDAEAETLPVSSGSSDVQPGGEAARAARRGVQAKRSFMVLGCRTKARGCKACDTDDADA
jgi:hypothetical protein